MRELVIVQLNDLHGYMEPHPEWFWSPSGFTYREAGGVARIQTMLNTLRAIHKNLLFCDNGDTFHGTRAVVATQGACLVPILNRLGLSAMTGHWDFAYGPGELQQRVSELTYPFLACNVYRCAEPEDPGTELAFPPFRVLTVGDVSVGIIGIACNIVDKTMPPHFSEGIRFTDGREELPRYIQQLRTEHRVDLVLLLSHLGLPQDLELLVHTPGVDVCLSSHTHNRLTAPARVDDTLVIQSGCHGSFLGKLHLRLDDFGKVSLVEHALLEVSSSIPSDPEVHALVEAALQPFRTELNEVAGHTPIALNRATMLESTADNLLLDAMLHATGADLAFANGWRYGAPIPTGPVAVNDIYNLAPMNPEIMLVDLTGDELWRMIEENLERTFSREPFSQMGGYVKRCGGMKTFFKVENPKGQRVQDISVGGSRLDRSRTYQAAFITVQAVPQGFGANRRHTGKTLLEATKALLQAPVSPALRDSFVEV